MSRTVVYIFAGVVGVFYVLPKVVWLIAGAINRYIHPDSTKDVRATEDSSGQHAENMIQARNARRR